MQAQMIVVVNYKVLLYNTAVKAYQIMQICLKLQEKNIEKADFPKFKRKPASFEINNQLFLIFILIYSYLFLFILIYSYLFLFIF